MKVLRQVVDLFYEDPLLLDGALVGFATSGLVGLRSPDTAAVLLFAVIGLGLVGSVRKGVKGSH